MRREQKLIQQRASDHHAPCAVARAPLAMTGPVGRFIGDPPAGSTETASRAAGPSRASSVAPNGNTVTVPGLNTPNEIGAPPAGMSHNCVLRSAAMLADAAGTTTICLRSRSTVAVQSATPLSWRMLDTISTPEEATGGCRAGTINSMTMQATATTDAPAPIHCQKRTLLQRPGGCRASPEARQRKAC